MNLGITVGYKKGGEIVIISDPSISISTQKADFKSDNVGNDVERIELWTRSEGLVKSKRIRKKSPVENYENNNISKTKRRGK